MPKANPWSAACPSRTINELLASKWVLLLPALLGGPKRNGELMRALGGVSQKMLTQTLRDLERFNIVERYDYAQLPPRVEYSLTRRGASLARLLASLDEWVIKHYGALMSAAERNAG
jgi:DNA-binding HxlR family transcriptional regulator